MENQKKIINSLDHINPFCRPSSGLPSACVTKDTEDDKYIIERALIDVVVKTGEGKTDFVVKKELQEISRKNRQEYINQHREDVGILNIMKKVQATGDATLLNQRQVNIGFADLTELPEDKIEAMKVVEAGVNAFDNLPDDVKKKMSMEQFAKQTTAEYDQLIADIVKKVQDAQKTQESQKIDKGDEK